MQITNNNSNDEFVFIIDTETTGIESSSEIVEIAILKCDATLSGTGEILHRYFNPTGILRDGAVAVHKLTSDFLAQYDKFSHQDMVDILTFIGSGEVVGHNILFDMAMLDNHMSWLDFTYSFSALYVNRYHDTLAICRRLVKSRSHSLDKMCEHFGIDLSSRDSGHDALGDCHLVRKLCKHIFFDSNLPIQCEQRDKLCIKETQKNFTYKIKTEIPKLR